MPSHVHVLNGEWRLCCEWTLVSTTTLLRPSTTLNTMPLTPDSQLELLFSPDLIPTAVREALVNDCHVCSCLQREDYYKFWHSYLLCIPVKSSISPFPSHSSGTCIDPTIGERGLFQRPSQSPHSPHRCIRSRTKCLCSPFQLHESNRNLLRNLDHPQANRHCDRNRNPLHWKEIHSRVGERWSYWRYRCFKGHAGKEARLEGYSMFDGY